MTRRVALPGPNKSGSLRLGKQELANHGQA
jgi:hypothetical protein